MALTDYLLDIDEFKAFGPEFNQCDDAVLEFFFEAAKPKINPDVFKDQTKIAHFFWMAHLIAMSPYGRNLRLQSDNGITDYYKNFQEILKTCGLTAYVCNSGI